MTNKLEPILDFIVLDDEQVPLLNVQGLPTLKQGPIVKSIEPLIAKGKVQNIEMFAQLVSEGEQWDWARDYYNYLVGLNKVAEFNANLPAPVANEDGSASEVEPQPEPTAPQRPVLKTIEQVLAPYSKKIQKMKGLEFKGVNVSLSETNQNGLSALKTALDLAKEFGVDDQFFPVKFNAETSSEIEVVELLDEAEFKLFGLNFILARKAFFE